MLPNVWKTYMSFGRSGYTCSEAIGQAKLPSRFTIDGRLIVEKEAVNEVRVVEVSRHYGD